MDKLSVFVAAVIACFILLACGAPPKQPVTGADLVATAVAARYAVTVDDVREVDGRYEWTVSAVNGSGYTWKGTLYVKLVDAGNEIVESHDFKVDEMMPPGGKTTGLKFASEYAPSEMGGDITLLKAEVDVAYYEEPSAGGAD
ncbi:MAG: hypothetical protein V3W11_12090 [bacterium]